MPAVTAVNERTAANSLFEIENAFEREDQLDLRWGFFFFQAEDGIRDWSVTGVQTCALPIFVGVGLRFVLRTLTLLAGTQHVVEGRLDLLGRTHAALLQVDAHDFHAHLVAVQDGRSEERRVGKECRSRWSPYH